MASDFNFFIEELEANFGTYDPVVKQKAKLEGLCMHESHQVLRPTTPGESSPLDN